MKKAFLIIVVIAIAFVAVLFGKNLLSDKFSKAMDEKIYSSVVEGDDLPAEIQYSNAVYTSIQYDILSNNTISKTASVSFTYPDILALSEEYESQDNFNEEEDDDDVFYKYCIQRLEEGSAPTKTETININYSKEEGEYLIEDTPELANILTGGAYNLYIQIMGGNT